MQVRKAKRGEILPTIYMEGKESSKFDPDFFIVNVAHGVPSNKKGQILLKHMTSLWLRMHRKE